MLLLMGWFGPVGVSALFYASLVANLTGSDLAWVVGSLIVLASLMVHGVSAAPLARLHGRLADREHRTPCS